MQFFTRVFVRTSSLLLALYMTSMIRVLRVQASEPHEKFPVSRRSARNFLLPPRVRTIWTLFDPIFVLAAGLPNSNFLFLWGWGRFPPVLRLLCQESLDIPITADRRAKKEKKGRHERNTHCGIWQIALAKLSLEGSSQFRRKTKH